MLAQAWVSARKELEKIAASMNQLHAAYRRLPITRVKGRPKIDLSTSPNLGGDLKTLAHSGGMVGINPLSAQHAKKQLPHMGGMLRKQYGDFADEGQIKEMLGGVKAHTKNVMDLSSVGKRIVRPSGGGVGTMAAVAKGISPGALKGISPKGQRGINLVTGIHEGGETSAKHIAPFAGHLNPTVLAEEHNTLNRLTGPGADETRGVFSKMRGDRGETAAYNNYLTDMFGPQANRYGYGGREKMPKAMRKQLSRRSNRAFLDQIEAMRG